MINFNKPKHLIIGMHFADDPPQNATESTGDVLSAYVNYLPPLMQALNAQVIPQAETELAAAQRVSPEYQKLNAELYAKIAPMLAATGRDIDRTNRIATAETDVDILDTSGRNLAKVYDQIDREINPEYYETRKLAAARLGDVLSESLNNPDIQGERLIAQEEARTGNDAAPSAVNTVTNALRFGDREQTRVSNLSNAIATASGSLSSFSNPGFSFATTALNKPTSNTGVSQFGGVKEGNNTAYQVGQGFMNNVTGLQQSAMDINANRRDIFDRVNEGISSVGSLV